MENNIYTYKNIFDETLYLPNVGEVKPGKNVSVTEELNNSNFELLKTEPNVARPDETINETKEK